MGPKWDSVAAWLCENVLERELGTGRAGTLEDALSSSSFSQLPFVLFSGTKVICA